MGRRIKGGCPACGGELEIAKYRCPNCDTEISGRFQSCNFCHLDPEVKHFITVFILKRGNIKLVERELGISYPTVRKELRRAITALGYSADEDEVASISRSEKLAILDRLEKGNIDYETAIALLEGDAEKEV